MGNAHPAHTIVRRGTDDAGHGRAMNARARRGIGPHSAEDELPTRIVAALQIPDGFVDAVVVDSDPDARPIEFGPDLVGIVPQQGLEMPLRRIERILACHGNHRVPPLYSPAAISRLSPPQGIVFQDFAGISGI